jgi:hypothetical protein
MRQTASDVLQRLGRPLVRAPTPTESSLLDELVMAVASPMTKDSLEAYFEQHKVQECLITEP